MVYRTFDDVLIKPQFSCVPSRQNIWLEQSFFGLRVDSPLIPANMDTIVGTRMAIHLANHNRLAFLYRPIKQNLRETFKVLDHIYINLAYSHEKMRYVVPSVSLSAIDDFYGTHGMFLQNLRLIGCNAVCIDVAHGHHMRSINLIEKLRQADKDWASDNPLVIIAGNIATPEAATDLIMAGANVLKIGIGPGAACTTRLVTGHGVPQLSAIESIAKIAKQWPVKLIADGGIRNSGDAAKALAAGADYVMCGRIFAGTDETPGKIMRKYWFFGSKTKTYRGMASFDAQTMDKNRKPRVEGVSYQVPYIGPVEQVFDEYHAGIRSALSYSGSLTLNEFHQKAVLIDVSANTPQENIPHGN